MIEITDEIWEYANEMYKKMVKLGKQVFFTITCRLYENKDPKTEDFYIWSFVEEDKEICLVPVADVIEGQFCFDFYGSKNMQEMIPCNDYHFQTFCSDDEETDQEMLQKILSAITDPDYWTDADYAECKRENNTDFMYMVRKGDKLPEDATGKFLRWNFEEDRFKYTDGSEFVPNDEDFVGAVDESGNIIEFRD